MASTTLTLPPNYTAYYAPAGNLLAVPGIGAAFPTTVVTLAAEFTLYLPIPVTPIKGITVAQVIEALNGTQQLPDDHAPAFFNAAQIDDVAPLPDGILDVPILQDLDSNVDVRTLINSLEKAYGDLNSTKTTSLSSSSQPTSIGSVTIPTTSSSSDAGNGSSPTSSANNAASTDNGATNDNVSQPIFSGVVAGAIIGGLLVGAVVCFLVLFCCFRNRRPPKRTSSEESYGDASHVPIPLEDKTPRTLERSVSVVGWQKHLPQEKGDRAIRNTFQALFEHIQMHVDGYYGNIRPSNEAIGLLSRVSEDRLHEKATYEGEMNVVLQAILTRWIVHRISLHSGAEESLLPSEYTAIPETRKWHMERDGPDKDSLSASKRGLPQAFSEWRMLTAFIRPDPQSDADCERTLNAKINRAVHTFNEAFAPCQLPNKSASDRSKSLQSILKEASQAGIMLFRQRSVYVFDWSSSQTVGARSFVVTPALVKELDEYGEVVKAAEPLIRAT